MICMGCMKSVVPALAMGLVMGSVACSAGPNATMDKASAPSAKMGSAAPEAIANSNDAASQVSNSASNPVAKPQLIRTASLRLTVRSIDQTLNELRTVIQQQQGDIYNFDDIRATGNDRRAASLEIKVPQENLDKTLERVGQLGNLVSTQVKSEDVTTQIVDTEARLKNLRQQEAMTQKIMERSGSVKDILAVSKELATVREQIERIDAQVKQLKGRVAFSTITLSLEEAVSSGPNREESLGWQVQDTWTRSTRSASGLMRGIFLFGIGLVPFIPFLLLLGGGGYLVRRRLKSVKRSTIAASGGDNPT
jgi:hypothetical protein